MSDKKAIVFDTNFIIVHISDLRIVHQKLSETYDVFVSDVSIQERLSQKFLDLKAKYDKIEKFKKENSSLASIRVKNTFEVQFESEREFTRKGYKELFGNNIIAFSPTTETLETVMDRVFKKIPPFSSGENASDKGFKDTLLWISLLEYFKTYIGDSVIFVTDDKGFINKSDAMCKEFNEFTGKSIEIQPNSFYDSFIEKKGASKEIKVVPLPDVSVLREQVQTIVSAICVGADEDWTGNTYWRKTFAISEKVAVDDIKSIFGNLRDVLANNLFEIVLPANVAFGIENITNEFPVAVDDLQKALALYEDISSKMPDFMLQFFNAAVNIFNRNYQEKQKNKYDDLPF